MERKLGDLELRILMEVPTSGPQETHAYVVWVDKRGELQMGPCRWRRVTQGMTYWDCSPFPGGWDYYVTLDQIKLVRHPQALVDRYTASKLVAEAPWDLPFRDDKTRGYKCRWCEDRFWDDQARGAHHVTMIKLFEAGHDKVHDPAV